MQTKIAGRRPGPLALAALLSVTVATAAPAQDRPAAQPAASIAPDEVKRGVDRLPAIVDDIMRETGVPGIAVAVVHRDEVVFMRGYGLRRLGWPEPIETDTVFQVASVSKPIASTVAAWAVGRGLLKWDGKVVGLLPGFELSAPQVTDAVTVADMLAHRSGLRTAAGDLLEDMGYDRATILKRLRMQPLEPFRTSYHYSNFGYTAGGVAAAAADGRNWEHLAEAVLFRPAGMIRSSFRSADYRKYPLRAYLHVRTGAGGKADWQAVFERDPDAQAPAGGASSSIADIARFMRLHLGDGMLDGKRIIDAGTLAATHLPYRIPGGEIGAYGLGWNVDRDGRDRTVLSHSGAFYLGAATHLRLWPSERLGIAVLTNGEPISVPEAISRSFLDVVETGQVTADWLGRFGPAFQAMRDGERASFLHWRTTPADPRPSGPLAGYTGTYGNAYYGPIRVWLRGPQLTLELGPAGNPTPVDLVPYDGDTFVFETFGENAVGLAGAAFRRDGAGAVDSVTLDFYDRNGLGTFTRTK